MAHRNQMFQSGLDECPVLVDLLVALRRGGDDGRLWKQAIDHPFGLADPFVFVQVGLMFESIGHDGQPSQV